MIALVSAALAGCDETFVPLQPLETELSVFGYLDASADTQWVRVTRIRPLATTTRTPFDGRVSAEHLGNGQVLEFRDTPTWFRTADVGGEGVYLNNFWTTERVEPGSTYRFAVVREGKPAAEAVIEIPPEFEIELAIAQHQADVTTVYLEGVRYVAFTNLIQHLEDGCGDWTWSERQRQVTYDPDAHVLAIVIARIPFIPARPGCGSLRMGKREIWIAASGSEWPSGVDFLTGRLGVPEGPSNISHALGFLGGVLTRTIPFEGCSYEPGPPSPGEFCRLRFDDTRATLRGIAIDARCEDRRPVERLTVNLREKEPGQNGRREVRSTTSDRTGAFAFHGLRPDTPYQLTIEMRPSNLWGAPPYLEYTDTMAFVAGEDRFLEVEMQRLNPC